MFLALSIKDEVFYVQSGAIELSYGWNADKKLSKTITLIEEMFLFLSFEASNVCSTEIELFEFSVNILIQIVIE